MKKKLPVLGLLLAFLFLFAACADNGDTRKARVPSGAVSSSAGEHSQGQTEDAISKMQQEAEDAASQNKNEADALMDRIEAQKEMEN